MAAASEPSVLHEMAELLAFLHQCGPLKRAYPIIQESLVGRLGSCAAPHAVVLSSVEALLSGSAAHVLSARAETDPPQHGGQWPGTAANAYCSLLLEAAAKPGLPAPEGESERVRALTIAYPKMFRKLTAAYGKAGMGDAALATVKHLLANGDPVEAAFLAIEYGLLESIDSNSLVKTVAALQQKRPVYALLDAQPALQGVLVDHLMTTGQHKATLKLIVERKLQQRVSRDTLTAIAVEMHKARLHWLVRSRLYDLVDMFFGEVASAIRSDSCRGQAAACADGEDEWETVEHADACPPDDSENDRTAAEVVDAREGEGVDKADDDKEGFIWKLRLPPMLWLELAVYLSRLLVMDGLRKLAVHSAVRHELLSSSGAGVLGNVDISYRLKLKAELGEISAEEYAEAASVSEEQLVLGDIYDTSTAAKPKAEDYLRLELPASGIVDVHDARTLEELRNTALCPTKGSGQIGIDVEWANAGGVERVQWLQIATGRAVFLLDIPALTGTSECAAALRDVVHALMTAKGLLKIGFGLADDLRKLREAHPSLASVGVAAPIRELAVFCTSWLERRPTKGLTPGLSQIAEEVLGRPVDKRVRLTNWARRPLTASQRRYAALDAHCLLLINQKMESRMSKSRK
ncbi:hypothetical protein AB1Y20_017964 [Prymnesium parvum]|uniref:3'-5' exonuclease domain-containing protein n=1 Tax=Prymnesium parvum TaxID=97485 RepID=A0AB34JNF8_PRYPA